MPGHSGVPPVAGRALRIEQADCLAQRRLRDVSAPARARRLCGSRNFHGSSCVNYRSLRMADGVTDLRERVHCEARARRLGGDSRGRPSSTSLRYATTPRLAIPSHRPTATSARAVCSCAMRSLPLSGVCRSSGAQARVISASPASNAAGPSTRSRISDARCALATPGLARTSSAYFPLRRGPAAVPRRSRVSSANRPRQLAARCASCSETTTSTSRWSTRTTNASCGVRLTEQRQPSCGSTAMSWRMPHDALVGATASAWAWAAAPASCSTEREGGQSDASRQRAGRRTPRTCCPITAHAHSFLLCELWKADCD